MKKLGSWFYIVLATLTVGVLGALAVWLSTENDLFLYLMLGLFPVYVAFLVLSMVLNGKREKKRGEEKSAFLLLAREEAVKVVYVTYLGGERGVRKPSKRKKDYLVEFYTGAVDENLLKKHLWFGLSDADEQKLGRCRTGETYAPFPFLCEISGKTVLIQARFFEAAKDSPLFAKLFADNEIVLYGE